MRRSKRPRTRAASQLSPTTLIGVSHPRRPAGAHGRSVARLLAPAMTLSPFQLNRRGRLVYHEFMRPGDPVQRRRPHGHGHLYDDDGVTRTQVATKEAAYRVGYRHVHARRRHADGARTHLLLAYERDGQPSCSRAARGRSPSARLRPRRRWRARPADICGLDGPEGRPTSVVAPADRRYGHRTPLTRSPIAG